MSCPCKSGKNRKVYNYNLSTGSKLLGCTKTENGSLKVLSLHAQPRSRNQATYIMSLAMPSLTTQQVCKSST